MKKNVFYLITVFIIGLYSCSSDEYQQEVSQTSKVEEIRSKAISDFYGTQTRNNPDFSQIDEKVLEDLSQTYETNLNFVLSNNVYTLLENHNLNGNIIDALIDYDNNYRSNEKGLELICEKYKLSEQDIYYLAFGIETFDYLIDSIPTTRSASKVANCAVAVVGSVITTLGATTIASGWGLGLFLVGKAVSLYGIATCAS